METTKSTLYNPTPLEHAFASHLLITIFNQNIEINESSSVNKDGDCDIDIGGRDAVSFLTKSGVERDILRAIWNVADPEGIGTLHRRSQLHVILRLVAMGQIGMLPSLDSSSAGNETLISALKTHSNLKFSLPEFEGVPSMTSAALLSTYEPSLLEDKNNDGTPSNMIAFDSSFQQSQIQKHLQQSNSQSNLNNLNTVSISDAFGALVEVQDLALPSTQSLLEQPPMPKDLLPPPDLSSTFTMNLSLPDKSITSDSNQGSTTHSDDVNKFIPNIAMNDTISNEANEANEVDDQFGDFVGLQSKSKTNTSQEQNFSKTNFKNGNLVSSEEFETDDDQFGGFKSSHSVAEIQTTENSSISQNQGTDSTPTTHDDFGDFEDAPASGQMSVDHFTPSTSINDYVSTHENKIATNHDQSQINIIQNENREINDNFNISANANLDFNNTREEKEVGTETHEVMSTNLQPSLEPHSMNETVNSTSVMETRMDSMQKLSVFDSLVTIESSFTPLPSLEKHTFNQHSNDNDLNENDQQPSDENDDSFGDFDDAQVNMNNDHSHDFMNDAKKSDSDTLTENDEFGDVKYSSNENKEIEDNIMQENMNEFKDDKEEGKHVSLPENQNGFNEFPITLMPKNNLDLDVNKDSNVNMELKNDETQSSETDMQYQNSNNMTILMPTDVASNLNKIDNTSTINKLSVFDDIVEADLSKVGLSSTASLQNVFDPSWLEKQKETNNNRNVILPIDNNDDNDDNYDDDNDDEEFGEFEEVNKVENELQKDDIEHNLFDLKESKSNLMNVNFETFVEDNVVVKNDTKTESLTFSESHPNTIHDEIDEFGDFEDINPVKSNEENNYLTSSHVVGDLKEKNHDLNLFRTVGNEPFDQTTFNNSNVFTSQSNIPQQDQSYKANEVNAEFIDFENTDMKKGDVETFETNFGDFVDVAAPTQSLGIEGTNLQAQQPLSPEDDWGDFGQVKTDHIENKTSSQNVTDSSNNFGDWGNFNSNNSENLVDDFADKPTFPIQSTPSTITPDFLFAENYLSKSLGATTRLPNGWDINKVTSCTVEELGEALIFAEMIEEGMKALSFKENQKELSNLEQQEKTLTEGIEKKNLSLRISDLKTRIPNEIEITEWKDLLTQYVTEEIVDKPHMTLEQMRAELVAQPKLPKDLRPKRKKSTYLFESKKKNIKSFIDHFDFGVGAGSAMGNESSSWLSLTEHAKIDITGAIDRRKRAMLCLSLYKILITSEHSKTPSHWAKIMKVVKNELAEATMILNEALMVNGTLSTKEKDSIVNSEKIHIFVLGLAEFVRVARFIKATIDDLFCQDIADDNDLARKNEMGIGLIDDFNEIESSWTTIALKTKNVGLELSIQIETVCEMRTRRLNSMQNEIIDQTIPLCNLTLQPECQTSTYDRYGESICTTSLIEWEGRNYLACTANFWANKISCVCP